MLHNLKLFSDAYVALYLTIFQLQLLNNNFSLIFLLL